MLEKQLSQRYDVRFVVWVSLPHSDVQYWFYEHRVTSDSIKLVMFCLLLHYVVNRFVPSTQPRPHAALEAKSTHKENANEE
jgi:hypothetical protein